MKTAPGQARAGQSDIRRNNLGVIMECLFERQPISRAKLAIETGLTKATVSTLVAELIGAGMVDERERTTDHGLGRPATMLAVSGERLAAIGVELDIDLVGGCVMDLSGRLRTVRTVNKRIPRGSKTAMNELSKLVQELLEEARGFRLEPVGVAVALPGLVDRNAGRLRTAPNLGWVDFPVVEYLAQAIGSDVQITIDNNANLGAIALQWQRPADTRRDFIYVASSVGIGAGVVIDGELFRGAHGFANELGHVIVDMHGPKCICGNRGCLGAVVGEALRRESGVDSTGGLWLDELLARLEDGDATTIASVAKAGEALAAGVISLVNLFDPSVIVLSGPLESLLPWIREPIEAALRDSTLGSSWRSVELRGAELGRTAPLIGGAVQLLNDVLSDPFAWTTRVATAAAVPV
jgi:predicted NBD/HSP70 family sugar kinase